MQRKPIDLDAIYSAFGKNELKLETLANKTTISMQIIAYYFEIYINVDVSKTYLTMVQLSYEQKPINPINIRMLNFHIENWSYAFINWYY